MRGLDLTAEEVAGLAARHPSLMHPPLAARLGGLATALLIVGIFGFGLWSLDISPARLAAGTVALVRFLALMVPPDPLGHAALFTRALGETLAISLLGTLLAAVLAFPMGLLAARNVVANPVVHALVRRVFDVIRSIDVLVWALVWIGVVGLGPFAGVLAIACSDFGAFGKLFSETVETTGHRAARACGRRAAPISTRCASASCPRSCRCWPGRCSTSSSPTSAPPPSSASWGRAASASTSTRRSAPWNGGRSPSWS